MSHPYVQYENGPFWTLLDRAIADLERNQDVTLTAARSHVIGYLCKHLAPLEHGGSLRVAAVWQWLCEHAWPAHLTDDDRLELARDVVRIADAGTVVHVSIFLRDMLPATVAPPVETVAPQLMQVLDRSRGEQNIDAF